MMTRILDTATWINIHQLPVTGHFAFLSLIGGFGWVMVSVAGPGT